MNSQTLIPTGQWNGFYTESHKDQRGWMHQYLEFNDGELKGEGTDYVGPWTLQGKYDLSKLQCQWVKIYVGKHHVNYLGTISKTGITGVWDIRGSVTGPFHIWPQHLTEFDSLYMQQDIEQTPLKQQPQPPINLDDLDLDAGGHFLA